MRIGLSQQVFITFPINRVCSYQKRCTCFLVCLQNIEIWNPEIKADYDNQNPEPFENVAQLVTEKILNKNNLQEFKFTKFVGFGLSYTCSYERSNFLFN